MHHWRHLIGAHKHWHNHKSQNSTRKSHGLQPLAPHLSDIRPLPFLSKQNTYKRSWQTQVGGGRFTIDLGTPKLAVGNRRLFLYNCNALSEPEDHFLPLLVAENHLQRERSTIRAFDGTFNVSLPLFR